MRFKCIEQWTREWALLHFAHRDAPCNSATTESFKITRVLFSPFRHVVWPAKSYSTTLSGWQVAGIGCGITQTRWYGLVSSHFSYQNCRTPGFPCSHASLRIFIVHSLYRFLTPSWEHSRPLIPVQSLSTCTIAIQIFFNGRNSESKIPSLKFHYIVRTLLEFEAGAAKRLRLSSVFMALSVFVWPSKHLEYHPIRLMSLHHNFQSQMECWFLLLYTAVYMYYFHLISQE